MVSKEDLLTSSSMARCLKSQGRSIKVVLSPEELQDRLDNGGKSIQIIESSPLHGEGVYFFTDDYCVGVNIPEFKEKGLTPASIMIPYKIKPRPGFEDGYIKNVAEYQRLHCNGMRLISNIDELLEYLNS